VLRNHPFEFVASVLKTFLRLRGWKPRSLQRLRRLSQRAARHERDVVLVWVDFERYGLPQGELAEWFGRRLTLLPPGTDYPIVVSDWER